MRTFLFYALRIHYFFSNLPLFTGQAGAAVGCGKSCTVGGYTLFIYIYTLIVILIQTE